MNIRLLLLAVPLLLSAACAHQNPTVNDAVWRQQADIVPFETSGRLALHADGKGYYAQFDWLRSREVQSLSINLPIGGSIGTLCADRDGARLTAYNGETYRAADLAELSRMLLGYELPLVHLDRWINGQTVPDEPHTLTGEGYLKQLGWTIQRHTDGQGRPHLLLLERPQMRLRLVLNRFAPPEQPPESCSAYSS